MTVSEDEQGKKYKEPIKVYRHLIR